MPLRALSLVAFYEGRLGESAELEGQILRIAETADERYDVVYSWGMRALIATYQGDPDAARSAAERACDEADRLGNTHMRALSAYCRGEALAKQDPDEALVWLGEAIRIARGLRVRLIEAIALVTRSSIRAREGEPGPALGSLREAVVRLRHGGNWTHQWTTLRNLVFLLARVGADEPAVELLGAIDTTTTSAGAYGTDAERLRDTTLRLRERLDGRRFADAHARGRHRNDAEAVDAALVAIDRQLSEVAG